MDAVDLYLADIGKHPLLKPEEEIELAKAIQGGCETSRTKMITCNLRLVVSIAQTYEDVTSARFLDVVNAGNIGLMQAIDRFDYKRGNKLSTYAVWWIKQAIRLENMRNGRTIRCSANALKSVSAERTAARRAPQDEAAQDRLAQAERKLPTTVSLDAPSPVRSDGRSIAETYADPLNRDPAIALDDEDVIGKLYSYLQRLEPRERKILEQRFGLNGYEAASLNDVGERYKVTRERIRQLQNRGLKRLQQFFFFADMAVPEPARALLRSDDGVDVKKKVSRIRSTSSISGNDLERTLSL